jgi:phage host-nuclease inhibitor protein Gam
MGKQLTTESALHQAINKRLVELGRIEIRLERIHGEMDLEIARIKADRAAQIASVVAQRQDVAREIEALCSEHRGELLRGAAKSLKLLFGRIGWRVSPPSVGLARGVDAERAAMLLREHGHGDLVRERLEPNKPVIMAALAAEKITEVELKGAGLKVEPGREEFNAVPDRTEIEKIGEE